MQQSTKQMKHEVNGNGNHEHVVDVKGREFYSVSHSRRPSPEWHLTLMLGERSDWIVVDWKALRATVRSSVVSTVCYPGSPVQSPFRLNLITKCMHANMYRMTAVCNQSLWKPPTAGLAMKRLIDEVKIEYQQQCSLSLCHGLDKRQSFHAIPTPAMPET